MGSRTADISKFIENGEIEAHAVVIDSSDRDRTSYPEANEYKTTFEDPYYNVVSVEILDAYIPKMNLDTESETLNVNIIKGSSNITYPITYFGFSNTSFVSAFNSAGVGGGSPGDIQVTERQVSVAGTQTNISKFNFKSTANAFSIDATKMTNTELERFGLKKQIYQAVNTSGTTFEIDADLRYNFIPDIYINVSCDEIDSMVNRGKMNKQTMSFGRITLGGNRNTLAITQDFDNMSLPPRYFHPIASLASMTLRFKKKNGELYDFQGLNHVITLVIRCIVIKDHLLPQSHGSTTIAENVSKHIDNTKKIKEHNKEIKLAKQKKLYKTQEKKNNNEMIFYGITGLLTLGSFYFSYS